MSEPAASTSAVVLHHHHHPRRQHPPTPSPPPPPAVSPSSPTSPSTATIVRDYRKGNWTIQETLNLINAKRLDDERRVQRQTSGGGGISGGPGTQRTAELRWKWVENYCWNQGCMRSQNQCNDKWDNLLRDYKKVRDYEAKAAASRSAAGTEKQLPSYWGMEKQERKEHNLPSNLAAEVFDVLTDVLSRRNASRCGISASATAVSSGVPTPTPSPPTLPPAPPLSQEQLPPLAQQPSPPPPPPPVVPAQPSVSVDVSSETSGTEDERNYEGSAAATGAGNVKRRRIGRSVLRGASVLARTLMACEEKREKRHRDLIELEQRRLHIEEDRTEVSRQGFAGLIAAVNNLSGAIHALVSQHHHRCADPR